MSIIFLVSQRQFKSAILRAASLSVRLFLYFLQNLVFQVIYSNIINILNQNMILILITYECQWITYECQWIKLNE